MRIAPISSKLIFGFLFLFFTFLNANAVFGQEPVTPFSIEIIAECDGSTGSLTFRIIPSGGSGFYEFSTDGALEGEYQEGDVITNTYADGSSFSYTVTDQITGESISDVVAVDCVYFQTEEFEVITDYHCFYNEDNEVMVNLEISIDSEGLGIYDVIAEGISLQINQWTTSANFVFPEGSVVEYIVTSYSYSQSSETNTIALNCTNPVPRFAIDLAVECSQFGQIVSITGMVIPDTGHDGDYVATVLGSGIPPVSVDGTFDLGDFPSGNTVQVEVTDLTDGSVRLEELLIDCQEYAEVFCWILRDCESPFIEAEATALIEGLTGDCTIEVDGVLLGTFAGNIDAYTSIPLGIFQEDETISIAVTDVNTGVTATRLWTVNCIRLM